MVNSTGRMIEMRLCLSSFEEVKNDLGACEILFQSVIGFHLVQSWWESREQL